MRIEVLPYKKMDVESRLNCGDHQIHAGNIIKDHLPRIRTGLKDAYALIGVTMEDLYPRDSWNFVFGLADMTGRNGVFSFARYDAPGVDGDDDLIDSKFLASKPDKDHLRCVRL